jgi:UDP-N-acetylmuramoylalanine--D-glutamate ligase
MRILGKGTTALALKNIYKEAKLFDDSDKEKYDYTSSELTIVSPGIPPFNDLVKNTKNIISDYDVCLTDENLNVNNEIFSVWISGTNGKTTTTQMCEYLLHQNNFIACGNIGKPLASVIKNNNKLLLETSSYTLHYTSYAKPNIYLLLPISEDHLSWHGSFEAYEKSKLKPIFQLDETGIAIIPSKYSYIKSNAKIITYSDSKDLANQFNIKISELHFKEPFLFDAILALCLNSIINNTINYKRINEFKTDIHKMEEFANINGVLYVNDSKATNIDATIQALKTYKDKDIHLILGGDDKGMDLNVLFDELQKYSIVIYAIGSNTNKLFELSKKYKLPCFKLYNLFDANKKIKSELLLQNHKNTLVLLSPAASSYDQFDSYKQRGEEFKKNIL